MTLQWCRCTFACEYYSCVCEIKGMCNGRPSAVKYPVARCRIDRACSHPSLFWWLGISCRCSPATVSVLLWSLVSQIWPLICDHPFSGMWGEGQGKKWCCPGAAEGKCPLLETHAQSIVQLWVQSRDFFLEEKPYTWERVFMTCKSGLRKEVTTSNVLKSELF